MKVYRVDITQSVAGVVGAVLFVSIGVIWFYITLGGELWWALGSLVWILVSGYIGLLHSQSTRQIQLTNDGSLVFVKMFGRDIVHIGDIQTIEAREGERGGTIRWTITITHTSGKVRMRGFAQASDLVSTLTMYNPAIIIEGEDTNSLAALHPDVAAQWHPTKNGDLTPDQVAARSGKRHWWQCPEGPDHEWEAVVASRTSGSGCPCCSGYKVSVTNSLSALHPDLAVQLHPTKNGDLTPDQVIAGSNSKFWWLCPEGPDHEWEAAASNRTKGTGCPCCSGHQVSITNSLAALYPDLAAQWHPTKNGDISPDQVVAGSHLKYWWQCPEGPDHEWDAVVGNRTAGRGCPCCRGLQVSVTNSLATLHPDVAAQWHPTKNGDLTPDQVVAGSARKCWWQCSEGLDHEWEATLDSRNCGTGCPRCGLGWTLDAIRAFVSSLKEHLQSFTPAELYLIFQQNGLLQSHGKGRDFVKALATGRFPDDEIEKFVAGDPSLVDEFVGTPDMTLEQIEAAEKDGDPSVQSNALEDDLDLIHTTTVEGLLEEEQKLPVVQTKDVLDSLDFLSASTADEEAE